MPPPIAGGMPPPIAGAGPPARVPMRGGAGAPPPMTAGMPRRDSPTRMPTPGGVAPSLSTSGNLPPPIGAPPAGAGGMPPPVGSGGPPIARRMRGREGAGAPAGFRAPATAGRGPPPFPGMASSNDNILPPPPGGDEQSTSTGSIPEALVGGGSGGGTSDGESHSPVSPPGSAPLVPRRTSTTQDDNYAPIPHTSADDGSGSGSSPAPPVAPRVGGSLTYSPRTGHRPDVSSRGMAPARRANVHTMPAPRGSTPPPALRTSARAPAGRDPTRRAMSMAISTEIPPPEPDNSGGSALPPPIGAGNGSALPPPIGGGNSALPPPIGAAGGLPPPLGARPAVAPKADVVVALYAYEAPNATNDRGEYAISFGQGERLVLSERREDGWYKGRNEAGQEGLIPGLYCKDE